MASGGTGGAGDGFLRSTFGGVASVIATARTQWTSPAFSYTGAGGSTPDEVSFTMDRRVNAGALLAVISGARYRVFLDDRHRARRARRSSTGRRSTSPPGPRHPPPTWTRAT